MVKKNLMKAKLIILFVEHNIITSYYTFTHTLYYINYTCTFTIIIKALFIIGVSENHVSMTANSTILHTILNITYYYTLEIYNLNTQLMIVITLRS